MDEDHHRELLHICNTVRTSAIGARIDFRAMQVGCHAPGHCARVAVPSPCDACTLSQAWMPSCTHELIRDVLSVCVSLHMVEDVVGPGPQDNYVWRGTEDTQHAVLDILKHAHANPHLLSGQLVEDDPGSPVTACGQRSDMALVCERLLLHLAARDFGGREHPGKQGGEPLELGPIAAKLRPQLAPFIPGHSVLSLLEDVARVLECFGCACVPTAPCGDATIVTHIHRRAHPPSRRPDHLL